MTYQTGTPAGRARPRRNGAPRLACSSVAIERDVPLARLTSIGLGGPAEFLARPNSIETVQALFMAAQQRGIPVRVLGRGTNVLVGDAGVRGLVLAMGPSVMNKVRVRGRRMVAGAGARLRYVIATALNRGLAGMEMLAGIPGSVGGAIRTNAGTREGDIGSVTRAVTAIDREGRLVHLDRSDLAFAYRSASVPAEVIVEVEFELTPARSADLKRRVADLRRRRRETQPVTEPNAGCIFKNPPGESAGRLIDRAGLKGSRVGGMEVSRRHANFLVNHGGATFDDARRLIDRVRDVVGRTFGVELELEVEIWQNRGSQAGIL